MKKNILALALTLFPAGAHAAAASSKFSNFEGFVNWAIDEIINPTMAAIFAVMIGYFFWGVTRYILSRGSQTERDKGVKIMINGVIAMFLMVTFWGFVYMIQSSFGL